MKGCVCVWNFLHLPRRDRVAQAEEGKYNVSRLARRLEVSVRTMDTAFRYHLGCPPKQALHEWRMFRACEELCRGKSVKEVAAELGFKDQAYFSNVFYVTFGERPSAIYRAPQKMASVAHFHKRLRVSTNHLDGNPQNPPRD